MEFVDLKSQYRALKSDIDARIQRVLDHGQYIIGPEVQAKVAAMEQANFVNCSQLNPPSQDAWTNCCYQGTKEIGRYTGLLLPVPILKNCKAPANRWTLIGRPWW